MRVTLFCGGRGSAGIARELARIKEIDLSLVINAYDDGLSTGDLRKAIKGMLGPSDFRKNISNLLPLVCSDPLLMEYRLPKVSHELDVEGLLSLLPEKVQQVINNPHRAPLKNLRVYIDHFFKYFKDRNEPFSFANCALGNLFFAGAFLLKQDFNEAIKSMAETSECPAELINVSDGTNRVLLGLTKDGTILKSEQEISETDGSSQILDLFLLDSYLTASQEQYLMAMPRESRAAALRKMERLPVVSLEAMRAIRQADLILYGPGTQHSSVFPSFKTQGLLKLIEESHARAKIQIHNVIFDHDIWNWSAEAIVDGALYYLADNKNAGKSITHVLSGDTHIEGRYHGADWVQCPTSKSTGSYHCPSSTVEAILDVYSGRAFFS